MALAAVAPPSPARTNAVTSVRFCTAPNPAPNTPAPTRTPASPATSPSATTAIPAAQRTSASGMSSRVPRRSASSPARQRVIAPVTPKTSSAAVATTPSGRSIGRNVTSPPPARVTTSRTTDGVSAASAAAR
jgi:hypothetical protein